MDIGSNPFVKDGWSIKGMIERDASGGICYRVEKRSGQDVLLSRIWEHPIPVDEDKIRIIVNEKGGQEAAALHFRIILDTYVQNLKLQAEMSSCPYLLCPDEYMAVKQDDLIGWNLYTRTHYCKTLREYLNGPTETEEVIKFGINICTAIEYCEQTDIGLKYIGLVNLF